MQKPKIVNRNMFVEMRTKYEEDLSRVYYSTDPKDTLEKFGWSRKEFEQKIELFEKKYEEDAKELVEYFTFLYNECAKRHELSEQERKEKKLNLIEIKQAFQNREMENASKLIEDVVRSGLSINEYASEVLYCEIIDIKKALRLITTSKEEYKEKLNELNVEKNKSFTSKLAYINEQMDINPDFDILDYYLNTKLSLNDFKSLVGSSKALGKFMTKYNTCVALKNYEKPSVFRKIKLEEKYITNGKEVSKEDIEYILDFMEEHHIPYTSQTYSLIRRKYLEGKLGQNQKTLIK